MRKMLATPDFYLMTFLGVFIISMMYFISYFGAPITDESFPIATALRFIQGQRPFVDDYSPYIPIGLLLAPVVKLSLWIHHGKNELMLFLRHAYVFLSTAIASYIFYLLQQNLPKILAFFLAASLIIVHLFGINNFHYDSLGVLFWTAILFQILHFQLTDSVQKYQFFIFSLFNVFLCFSYPTFIFLLIPFYVFYAFFHKHAKWMWLGLSSVGLMTALFLGWLLFYKFNITLKNIENTIDFSHRLFKLSSMGGTIFTKFKVVIERVFLNYYHYLITSTIGIFFAYRFQRIKFFPLLIISFLLFLPLFMISISAARYTECFFVYNCIGFLGLPLFLFFLRNNYIARCAFFYVWMPAIFAALVTSMTSYNLVLSFCVGFFPAVTITFLFVFLIIGKTFSKGTNYLLSRCILIIGLIIFSFFQFNYVYGSYFLGKEIYRQSVRYKLAGPFHGLYMEPDWMTFLSQLQVDVQKIDHDPNQFVYFGPTSSGYLLINYLKPGDYLLYCAYILPHYGEKIRLPSYVFDFSKKFSMPAEAIKGYLAGSSYKEIVTRPGYDLYFAN